MAEESMRDPPCPAVAHLEREVLGEQTDVVGELIRKAQRA